MAASFEGVESFGQCLHSFTSEIDECIRQSSWEVLADVLASRQQYLEQVLALPIPKKDLDEVRRLVEGVLAQDGEFQIKIQQHKKLLAEQVSSLERGRRAVRAYGSQ